VTSQGLKIVVCLDRDFSDEELLFVVHDNNLKLNNSAPIEVQCLVEQQSGGARMIFLGGPCL
jgi:hypothetical protein